MYTERKQNAVMGMGWFFFFGWLYFFAFSRFKRLMAAFDCAWTSAKSELEREREKRGLEREHGAELCSKKKPPQLFEISFFNLFTTRRMDETGDEDDRNFKLLSDLFPFFCRDCKKKKKKN